MIFFSSLSRQTRARDGFIFLISVLFIGVIAIAFTLTLLLFSIASQKSALAVRSSTQALLLAELCAERALLQVYQDSAYDGDELIELPEGSCAILPMGGFGNKNRSLCTEGTSGNATRRLEVIIQTVLPTLKVYAWQEVTFFTSCLY